MSIFDQLKKFVGSSVRGKFVDALLKAIAEGDEFNAQNILAVKENMVVATATQEFLEKLMASMGVTKPADVGIDDDLFRDLGITITNDKLVTNIFLDLLEVFYGSEAVRSNLLTIKSESYVLEDGDTLSILVDDNLIPLIIPFTVEDFTDINRAKASEVANLISRIAYNAGYSLTAQAIPDPDTNLMHVQLLSGTKGPKSSITVIGGRAQNILMFPESKQAICRKDTQFSMSFVDQYVRFAWTGGPDPLLAYVDSGDYVNIYGQSFDPINRGYYIVERVQGGPVGSAYFDIINPNFQTQAPVVLASVGGVSGGGTITRKVSITEAPTGAIRSSGVVIITTTAPHQLVSGQKIKISGVENTTFNGIFLVSSTTPTSIIYNQSGLDAISGLGEIAVVIDVNIEPLGAVRNNGISTIETLNAHNLVSGMSVQIDGIGDSSFNGFYSITVTGPDSFTYVQDQSNDVVFFKPYKSILQKLSRYASVYEINPYEIIVYIPATTRIIKRDLIGSWHAHDNAEDKTFLGSYIFDPSGGFTISDKYTTLMSNISKGTIRNVIFGSDVSQFPDQEGFIAIDFGTSNEEGPIRYLGRPSSTSLLIDPAYRFQKSHTIGADITLISSTKPIRPQVNGTDYQAYLTGTVDGRIEAEKLINQLVASGIFLNIVIVYPKDPGVHDLENYVYGV